MQMKSTTCEPHHNAVEYIGFYKITIPSEYCIIRVTSVITFRLFQRRIDLKITRLVRKLSNDNYDCCSSLGGILTNGK